MSIDEFINTISADTKLKKLSTKFKRKLEMPKKEEWRKAAIKAKNEFMLVQEE